MRFKNEIEFENWVRKALIDYVAINKLNYTILDNRKVFGIVICDNNEPFNLFFLEIKFHTNKKGKLHVGNGEGDGFQTEILKKRIGFLEKNTRWLIASEDSDQILFLDNETIRKNVMGNGIEINKQNNINLNIFRQCPSFEKYELINEIASWMNPVIILMKLGAEGGSITFYKRKQNEQYIYWFQTDESTLTEFTDEFDSMDLIHNSQAAKTFEDVFAIAHKKYKLLFSLYPLVIDNEIKEFISREYANHWNTHDEAEKMNQELWKQLLTIDKNDEVISDSTEYSESSPNNPLSRFGPNFKMKNKEKMLELEDEGGSVSIYKYIDNHGYDCYYHHTRNMSCGDTEMNGVDNYSNRASMSFALAMLEMIHQYENVMSFYPVYCDLENKPLIVLFLKSYREDITLNKERWFELLGITESTLDEIILDE